MKGDDLYFDLSLDERDAILRQTFEIETHLAGRDGHILDKFLLHLLHDAIVANAGSPFAAQLTDGFLEVFLKFLLRANLCDEHIHLCIDLCLNLFVAHLNGVDDSLVDEELLDGHLFGDDAIGVAIDLLTLVEHTLALILHFAAKNGFVAHHPDDLVDDVFGFLCHQLQPSGQDDCQCQ